MVRRQGGSRRKSRHVFKKHYRMRGKLSIPRYLQEFQIGEKVQLKAEPAIHSGLYHRRFHGMVGKIVGKRGQCYVVELNYRRKTKKLIVHPVHLVKIQ